MMSQQDIARINAERTRQLIVKFDSGKRLSRTERQYLHTYLMLEIVESVQAIREQFAAPSELPSELQEG